MSELLMDGEGDLVPAARGVDTLFEATFLSRRTRVVVAAPDPVLCNEIACNLADDGHEVFPFVDQWEALRHLRTACLDDLPDLVVVGDDDGPEAQVLATAARGISEHAPFLVVDLASGKRDQGAASRRLSLNDLASLRCAAEPDEVRFAARLLLRR